MKAAVFLDRDGTLIEERDYLSEPDQVALLPGAVDALRRLQDAGFLLFLVTNQSGVGRGFFTLDDVRRVHRRLLELLEPSGVRFADIYIAPEAPDQPSRGRKPSPQFLFDARDAFQAALEMAPEDIALRYNLAQSCEGLGDLEKAEKLYNECLTRDFNNADSRQALCVLLADLAVIPAAARAQREAAAELVLAQAAFDDQDAVAGEQVRVLDEGLVEARLASNCPRCSLLIMPVSTKWFAIAPSLGAQKPSAKTRSGAATR